MAKRRKHNNVNPQQASHIAPGLMENESGVMKHRQQNRTDSQQLFGWRKLEADDSKVVCDRTSCLHS